MNKPEILEDLHALCEKHQIFIVAATDANCMNIGSLDRSRFREDFALTEIYPTHSRTFGATADKPRLGKVRA